MKKVFKKYQELLTGFFLLIFGYVLLYLLYKIVCRFCPDIKAFFIIIFIIFIFFTFSFSFIILCALRDLYYDWKSKRH